MGLFRKRPTIDPEVLTSLRDEIQQLQSALNHADADREGLRSQVDELVQRPRTVEDTEVRRRVDALTTSLTAIDTLRERIDEVATSVEPLQLLGSRIDALESRVAGVSVELAAQIDELGRDIDALAATPPVAAAAEADQATLERLDTLRESQTRLAGEQARYQIAFREDLAELAEQIRAITRR